MSQLTNYIQKELDKGFSQDLVTKKLLQAGYTKQEISESFQSLKSAEPLLRRKSIEMSHMEFHIKWSRWVFGFLALVLVAVFGYLIYLYEGDLPTFEEVGVPSSCDGLAVEEKNICLLQLAQQGAISCTSLSTQVLQTICSEKLWDTNKCDYEFVLTKNITAREDCLWQQAIATGDISYCQKKVEDKTACFFQLAQAAQNPSICNHYVNCYGQYAVFVNNVSVCDMNEYDLEKERCIDYYTNNINTSKN